VADSVIVLSSRGGSNYSGNTVKSENPVDEIATESQPKADQPLADKKDEDEIDIDEIPF
jgi:hypothetical protein